MIEAVFQSYKFEHEKILKCVKLWKINTDFMTKNIDKSILYTRIRE